MTRRVFRTFLLGPALAACAFTPTFGQSTGGQAPGSQPASASPSPSPSPSASPAIDFSGVIFGNYQYRTDAQARAQTGGQRPNKFDIERVYLTFKMPVGDRAGIRATTDIFQNSAGGYNGGWTVRLKYAYLQYDLLKDIGGSRGFDALGRIGMLHTVVIDHEEGFWPRYLAPTVTDRLSFFSSADLGVATQLALPDKLGEIYGTFTNGTGYTAPENDRFKDYALRVSLTPFGGRSGVLKTVTISPWVYRGAVASKFATAVTGPITDAMPRDRWGLFVGAKDPRLTVGVHYASRTDAFESGATPQTRVETDSTGHAWSAYAVARPFRWTAGKNASSLGAVFRVDDFSPRNGRAGAQRFVVAGLQYEPTSRTAFSLDVQHNAPHGYPGAAPLAESKTIFVHWSANF